MGRSVSSGEELSKFCKELTRLPEVNVPANTLDAACQPGSL